MSTSESGSFDANRRGRVSELVGNGVSHGAAGLDLRARGAGALITHELEVQECGERNFSATDPEGHVWTFAQTLRADPAEGSFP